MAVKYSRYFSVKSSWYLSTKWLEVLCPTCNEHVSKFISIKSDTFPYLYLIEMCSSRFQQFVSYFLMVSGNVTFAISFLQVSLYPCSISKGLVTVPRIADVFISQQAPDKEEK